MTANQLKRMEIEERSRANKASEIETRRSNKAKEAETARSNRENEAITRNKAMGDYGNNLLSSVAKGVTAAMPIAKSFNDPAWYDHTPAVTRDVANISFKTALGTPINVFGDGTKTETPGIMIIRCIPTCGDSTGSASPINIAARNTYSFTRHQNSGSSNYEAPDQMLYILAMSNCYAFIAEMQRLYGCLNMYKAENRYFGKPMVEALGYDFEDMILHINDLRSYINMFIARIGVLAVPPFNIYKRHYYMFSTILSDSETEKDQLYVYVPYAFYQYDETSVGRLNAVPYSQDTGTKGFSFITSYGEQMLQKLLTSEDINIMSGDILKAYKDRVYKFDYTTPEHITPVVVGDLERTQLMNTVITTWLSGANASAVGRDEFTITQDNGILLANYRVGQTVDTGADDTFYFNDNIDKLLITNGNYLFRSEKVIEGAELLEAVENMVVVRKGEEDAQGFNTYFNILGVGSILPISAEICWLDETGALRDSFYSTVMRSDSTNRLDSIARSKFFDYAPTNWLIHNKANTPPVFNSWVSQYALISTETLMNMKEASILSLLNVPQNG